MYIKRRDYIELPKYLQISDCIRDESFSFTCGATWNAYHLLHAPSELSIELVENSMDNPTLLSSRYTIRCVKIVVLQPNLASLTESKS